MATKTFIIEVEEGMTKCGQCPDGFPCGGTGPIHCCDYNIATMKITEHQDWIKVEDSLPEYDEAVQVWGYWEATPEQGEWWASHRPSRKDVVVDEHGFAKVGKYVITHWRYVVPPKED